jgi:hypothetical protein
VRSLQTYYLRSSNKTPNSVFLFSSIEDILLIQLSQYVVQYNLKGRVWLLARLFSASGGPKNARLLVHEIFSSCITRFLKQLIGAKTLARVERLIFAFPRAQGWDFIGNHASNLVYLNPSLIYITVLRFEMSFT